MFCFFSLYEPQYRHKYLAFLKPYSRILFLCSKIQDIFFSCDHLKSSNQFPFYILLWQIVYLLTCWYSKFLSNILLLSPNVYYFKHFVFDQYQYQYTFLNYEESDFTTINTTVHMTNRFQLTIPNRMKPNTIDLVTLLFNF